MCPRPSIALQLQNRASCIHSFKCGIHYLAEAYRIKGAFLGGRGIGGRREGYAYGIKLYTAGKLNSSRAKVGNYESNLMRNSAPIE